jgi:mannose-6-phosphate isomerase-like protein (cupin superfamily)
VAVERTRVDQPGRPGRGHWQTVRSFGARLLGTSRTTSSPPPTKVNCPTVSRDFATKELPSSPQVVAPDGSSVRVLLDLPGGGLAQFTLPPGQTSQAVYHRTVEEIWFIVSGQGEMWRRLEKHDETVALHAGVCLTIPVGTRFQFRSLGADALNVVGVTMPPWPGGGEAVGCEGPWRPTLAPGPGLT